MSVTVDFGIDLGTTNSCVGRWENGAIRIFQNNDQMNVTPSAVHILRNGRMIVGRRAHSALLTDPDNVAIEFKRWMGQKYQKPFPASDRTLSPEELSAEILKSLREDVRRHTGVDMTTAVITVPAAFGALQCEGTARAASLAGLNDAPLLQEPIAAAIGYGVSTDTANQRWLVFDLGGGTLDIAVVSTREGRLNVLEHRGNNLLGGKDIDRWIVDRILMPALEEQFDVRAHRASPVTSTLHARLRLRAEEAKIDLSRDTSVLLSLFDLGNDDQGTPIELELELHRSQLDEVMEPMLRECCTLAREALASVRLTGSDLDRILLVGGPTQAPLIRSRLAEELGAPVDFSIDPMTVVARGAAIYASTLPSKTPQISSQTSTPQLSTATAPGVVTLTLAYEPVSSELTTIVAGRVNTAEPTPGAEYEIKLDADGGFWTSGWLKLTNNLFETKVLLKEADVTTFWIYLRDSAGHLIEPDVQEFRIRHGLVPSAPPLPHSLSVELLVSGGVAGLDAVFTKGTLLPAEKTVKYRTAHPIVPGDPRSDISIKLWEGEFADAPDANDWVGNLQLTHDGVRRRVPEGSEVEVTIQVSASRLITVAAFVPYLNQHFTNHVYLPQREEQDFSLLAQQAHNEIFDYQDQLQDIVISASNDPILAREIDELREKILALEALLETNPDANSFGTAPVPDPDAARRIVEASRTIRGRLARLQFLTEPGPSTAPLADFAEQVDQATKIVEDHGTPLEKQQLQMMQRELDRAVAKSEDRSVRRVCQAFEELRLRVLHRQDWYWRNSFQPLIRFNTFVDPTEANRLIAEGETAMKLGNGSKLQQVVRALWKLLPKPETETTRDRVAEAGLRRY
jgi:molecular chaperone DnaK